MPLINIKLLEGRPPEKKELLIQEVTNVVSKVLGAPKQSIRIWIDELEPQHFAVAGESVKKRKENEK